MMTRIVIICGVKELPPWRSNPYQSYTKHSTAPFLILRFIRSCGVFASVSGVELQNSRFQIGGEQYI